MIKLYNGDCLRGLQKLKDHSIDLVVMDPPYLQPGQAGSGAFGGENRKYYSALSGFSNGFSEEILFELDRVMKRINLYAFCNKKQLTFYLQHYKGCNFDLICWHKTNPIPATFNIYLRDTEYILFFREKGVPLFGTYDTKHTYYMSGVQRNTIHPTQKPIELCKRFIINSSKEGGIVLDPFMGSGTTGVASVQLGRNFIGMELVEEYFSQAKRRIQEQLHSRGGADHD